MRFLKLCILFFFLSFMGWSQTKYQVVTRVIEEKHKYNDQVISINGQNAKINVKGAKTSQIELTVKLIAKHPNLVLAKKALKDMDFTQQVKSKRIYLNNYVLFKVKPDKQTIYEVIYEITVPEEAELNIKNKPGNVNLQNLKGKIEIDHQMGEVTIKDCFVDLSAKLNVGELEIVRGEINGKLVTEYVSIIMRKCDGDIDLNTQFGTITMHMSKSLKNLKVKGNNTEVNIINTDCYDYNYNLTTSGGNISLNECIQDGGLIIEKQLNDIQDKKAYHIKKRPDESIINIYTKYADINIY